MQHTVMINKQVIRDALHAAHSYNKQSIRDAAHSYENKQFIRDAAHSYDKQTIYKGCNTQL